VLGWSFVVQPLLDRNRLAADLVPAREQVLVKRRDLVARKAAVRAELDAATARLEKLGERFLPASTPAVAASELQKTIKELATQATTEVRSERILPPVERGELLEIPIEVTVSGEIRQLVDLLARLESTPKFLSVQDFKIRVVNVSQPKELLATLTLSGFILTGRAKA
jgi:Tfp pilus assembly protein PilO